MLVGYCTEGPIAEAYAELTPPQRVRRAVEQGAKIHGPVHRDELDDAFSVAWNRPPFIEGGTVIRRDRGSGEYSLLDQPAGRVHFAGDWLSYVTGWQAGAMDSARYVVQVLHRRVGAEG